MKLGIRREKVGDILVFEEGADVVCTREIANYILNNLQQLTRFSKAKIEELNINNIRKPEIKKKKKNNSFFNKNRQYCFRTCKLFKK